MSSGENVGEKQLQQNIFDGIKSFYEAILENAQDGIWVSDKNDMIFYANPGMEKIAGVPRDKITGNIVTRDFPKETTEEFLKFYQKARNTLKPVWYEVRVKTPAGRNTWQNGWMTPRIDSKGNFNGMIVNIRDVTERVNTEFKLISSESKYKQLVETASDAIYLMDEEGLVVESNMEACKSMGYSKDEIIGLSIDKIDKNFDLNKFREFWKDKKFNSTFIIESVHITKNGKEIPVEVSTKKFKIEGKIFFYGIIRDITERKNTIQELELYRENLENLVKERTKELETKNEELERFNKLFVGREFRIKELKEQIKVLTEQIPH